MPNIGMELMPDGFSARDYDVLVVKRPSWIGGTTHPAVMRPFERVAAMVYP